MPEFSTVTIAIIIALTFLCEYMDSTLGMGYGTTLTPLLLLLGFNPMQIVPSILLSQLICGLLGAFFHHREGNVNLKPSTREIFRITNMLSPLGYIATFQKTVPPHLKVGLLLATCSVFGTIAAVFIAVSIPTFWVKLYIGVLVLTMGILILVYLRREFKFSWLKVGVLGIIASFNKGMTGGGYGPIVTGGQILSGVEGKSAVGITSLAEGLTCLVGVITYVFVSSGSVDWRLAPWAVLGAVFSVPLAAKTVRLIRTKQLNLAIALLTITLGSITIIKTLL
jgi:uncharacterized membrane protein YfcA